MLTDEEIAEAKKRYSLEGYLRRHPSAVEPISLSDPETQCRAFEVWEPRDSMYRVSTFLVRVGIMLFSNIVLMPLFLQTLLGYTAQPAGLVLSGGGLLLLSLMPVAGTLVSRVQARFVIAFGWLALAAGMFYTTQHLDLQISFATASFLRVVQLFGLGFLFVPISLVSYVGMPAGKNNSVAGLMNFMRNIGASIRYIWPRMRHRASRPLTSPREDLHNVLLLPA